MMNNTLPTPVISTNFFLYHKNRKEFFQEISTLGKHFQTGQAYNDACDSGFTLFNPKTGVEVRLVETRTIIHDNEVMGWEFSPIDKTHNFTVKIIND